VAGERLGDGILLREADRGGQESTQNQDVKHLSGSKL
jgi:hypothetical protein